MAWAGYEFARYNESADFRWVDERHPVGKGNWKRVWKGVYLAGSRAGKFCAVKRFRGGKSYGRTPGDKFDEEMRIVAETQEIVETWGRRELVGWPRFVLNWPIVTELADGEVVMVEPWIDDYFKLNWPRGIARDEYMEDRGERKMQKAAEALSHFSYHNSARALLLADIQGGLDRRGRFAISDPLITSRVKGTFGVPDLGRDVMRDFFKRHRCHKKYCRDHWIREVKHSSSVPCIPL